MPIHSFVETRSLDNLEKFLNEHGALQFKKNNSSLVSLIFEW